jgi:alpha-beta hydrolase superfamily lysophospholipase/SAM-dependent methyltransferase
MSTTTDTTEPPVAIAPVERTFRTHDNVDLFYRAWLPGGGVATQGVILLHRGHEHGGRLAHVAEALLAKGRAVFAWDCRGHGRSPGVRGDAEHVGVLVRDLDCFARHIAVEHRIRTDDLVCVGHSVAAVVLATWVHDYAPPIRGMMLATPAFDVRLYVPLAIPSLRLGLKAGLTRTVTSYVKSHMLTRDAEMQRSYDADPLITKNISTRVLLDLHDTAKRVVADAGAIVTPTLVMTAGRDWVVNNNASNRFVQNLSSADKRVLHYPGFGHAIFHEVDRALPIAHTREFVDRLFAQSHHRTSLLDADEAGYTKREYDALSRPLPLASPKRWVYGYQKLQLATVAKLSDGVRVGWATGFDSGRSLDYVYENKSRGITPVGRLIDRVYLDAIGWRGIRQRRVHLDELLRRAVIHAKADGLPIRLLDIASGPGRYMLEVLQVFNGDTTALCRDIREGDLDAGRARAAALGIGNVRFQQGDAFDADSLAAIDPPPTVAVVSGLFELFPSNDPVKRALSGLSRAMTAHGGYLLYTNQPWHPQVEMIARTLPNREGKPWVMRRRTQAEMDQLVAAAGFEKLDMRIDRWGIFTVSLARRVR